MTRAGLGSLVVLVVACGGGPARPPRVERSLPAGSASTGAAPPATPVFDTAAPPALRLPTNFVPEHYTARLALDPAQPTFTGEIAIRGDLAEASAVIWLHGKQLHVTSATATHEHATVELAVTPRGDDLLELRPAVAPLPPGHYELRLAYDGQIQPPGASAGAFVFTVGADRYLSTQFEATSARLVFPCVDEPGSKVPWQLALDVPRGQLAISNTPVARETPLDAGHVRVQFAETRPLPSYLIAFGVGPYEVVDAGHAASGTPLRVIVPKGQAARAAYAAIALPKIVDALAAWTDIPFPYPKLDLVARDAGGAMENAGIIMMDSPYVLLDGAQPAAIDRHALISVVGHETAHQWFGDLVTAAWWDDIWLNEAFATFMEDKVEMALEPAWRDDAFMVSRRTAAYFTDGLTTARQIRQPIGNEGDIHNAFDSITYMKGGAILAMFEATVSPELFQRGIRAYLRAHADHNATVTDLLAAIDASSGKRPIAAAFATFLDQPGVPELDVSVECTPGHAARAHLAQHRYVAPGGTAPAKPAQWTLPVCVAFETDAHARRETCGWVPGGTAELELADASCPAWVMPDGGAHGYARIAYTEAQVIALRDHGWAALSAVEQRSVFEDVRNAVLAGRLPVALLMSLAPRLLAGDRHQVGDATGDLFTSGGAPGLPSGLARFVPAELLPAARARVRTAIAPIAKRLGLVARPSDTLDDEVERLDVASAGAWAADPVLAREAVALAARYRTLPPSLRGTVLAIAVTASPAVAAQLRTDAFAEADPQRRRLLFEALGSIREPARLRAMLDTALDPRVTARDATALLTSWSDEPERAVVEAWLRAHWGDVTRIVPTVGSEDFPPLLGFLQTFSGACDPARRAELADYIQRTFGGIPSGARPAQQAIEWMDRCIAQRALVEPSLRAWLAPPPASRR